MNTENNKLLKEFIHQDTSLRDTDGYFKPLHVFNDKYLRFHSDWDWLMEVVEKTKQVGYLTHFNLNFKSCEISVIDIDGNILFKTFPKVNTQEKTMLSITYNACVEFIKWYNEQSQ